MEKSLEDKLKSAILVEDQQTVEELIAQGANPNKTTSHGKTCLGEAANIGNIEIVKILLDSSKSLQQCSSTSLKRKHVKSHKRKHKSVGKGDETLVKCRNPNERYMKNFNTNEESKRNDQLNDRLERNQGYFVFIHNDGPNDDSVVANFKSPRSSASLTPSPQADLEWDEDIVNVAPTTSEDETWTSMYKWYAAILESTGAAIAAASVVSNGIDQQDTYMRSALHYATDQGHVGVVKLLLDAGCKVDVIEGDGLTPLHVAVLKNYKEIAIMLLDAGSNVNNKTHEKMTPLHFASSRGYLELVQVLIKRGAYLEARDTNERTALYLAAGRDHADVVKCLITAGANVNGEEIHGYTPLCEAVWQRNPSVVEVLLASGARITHLHRLLHNAIIQRQEEIVKMLANAGAGINLHNDNGDTPLLLAARLSLPKIARILLERGGNANACNSITGAGVLHIAVESINNPAEFEELLYCLLEYNIDMNYTALTGDTALYRALLLHKDHAAVLLIRHGADVNACDLKCCGLDNLIIASRRHSPNLASMLLKAGHYVSYPDSHCAIPKQKNAAYWLYHASKNPFTLSDICRIHIRGLCGNRVLHRFIESLPLPKALKRFLMMEDDGI